MTATTFRLPLLVNGEIVEATSAGFTSIAYETGRAVEIPTLDADVVKRIVSVSKNALADLHFDDVSIFLAKVGALWADRSHPLRRRAVEMAHATTGVSREILDEDHDRIARSMLRDKLYDVVATDLDSSLVLDDWIPKQSVYVKAVPKGRVLHVLVGNVPLAGLFTTVRSVLTKNVTVAKLPSRDMISSLFFALAFREVDPDHPIARSLSVVYWPGGADVEQTFIDASDLVVAWGQKESVESIKRKIPCGTEFLELGPKRSLSLVGEDAGDLDDVAMRAAYDASVYDQEACFSAQRVFVEGDAARAKDFAARLASWLERLLARIPAAFASLDKQAHVTRARQEARWDGFEVLQHERTDWTVVVAPPEASLAGEHPLSRTVYVHTVASLDDALPWITRDVQTVGVAPWKRGFEMASDIARAGALRVVEVGLASRPRPGFVHDGMHALRRMVTFVAVERGLDYKGQFRAAGRDAFAASVFLKEKKP